MIKAVQPIIVMAAVFLLPPPHARVRRH